VNTNLVGLTCLAFLLSVDRTLALRLLSSSKAFLITETRIVDIKPSSHFAVANPQSRKLMSFNSALGMYR
jgi:hypothetical protein